jgi:hypothetical protein
MKRAFLVYGAESSGTRLLTRILILAGCSGDDGHEQRWDNLAPSGDLVVWRRSFPHAREVPDVVAMADRLRLLGYSVQALVISRDWYAAARSQVKAGHVPDVVMAERNLSNAYPYIFRGLAAANCPWRGVSYESLASKSTRRALLAALGLRATKEVIELEFQEANEKHYEEG